MDRPAPSRPATPDLRIVARRVYQGPNVWSYGPAVHLVVELGSLEEHPTDLLPGFADGLLRWLPGVGEHPCSRGRRGGFAERLREGTWVGHVVEHVALELQARAGHEVHRGRTRSTGVPGQYNVVIGYLDASVAMAAADLAVRIVNDLVAHEAGFDVDAELRAFVAEAGRTGLDASSRALVAVATQRDVPWMPLDGGVILVGQGRHARRVRGSLGPASPALAAAIAADGSLTRSVLAGAGLPVVPAEGQDPALPVNRGAPDATASAGLAEYRILVVAGRAIASARWTAGAVGTDAGPRDGSGVEDVTDRTHPDNAELAVDAARVLGLQVAGVDLAAPDIAQPVRGTGGGIRGIDPAADLALHAVTATGGFRDVAGPVLDTVLPPGSPGRIPIVAVTGSTGAATTAGVIGHVLAATGRSVGRAGEAGVSVGGTSLVARAASGARGARMVLAHPRTEVAVLEVSRAGILDEGLGYDRNDVAVVLNVAGAARGAPGMPGTGVEDLADIKSVVVEAVPPAGHAVLNADHPSVVPMAARCPGRVIWFSTSAEASAGREVVDRHCAQGGTAVVLDDEPGARSVTIRCGRLLLPLALPGSFPADEDDRASVVAAVAACVALDVRARDIGAALAGFLAVGNAGVLPG